MSPPEKTYTVGYALAPTKVDSFIQPSLLSHAKSRGIEFVSIDVNKPLTDQGPFDCVAHKLYDDEWKRNLSEYSAANPTVPIIDNPESIERLHNRVTMLECVNNVQIGSHAETFGVPKQIVVDGDLDPDLAINFPVIAKPMVANGTAKSHTMSLVFNRNGLRQLQPPVVLQEFVNHGGVVFKVYVAGGLVRCVKRKSLPDISESSGNGDSMSFSQISNLNGTEESHDYDKNILEAEMPPSSFVNDVADGLRKALKLHLFNFDMIRDGSDQRRYFVIDINYFPGYAKMPKYETMLTDFFLGIVLSR